MESNSRSYDKDKNLVKRRTKQHKSDTIDYMNYIPEAILFHILSFLPHRELIVMSLLSKRWKGIVASFFSVIPQNLNFNEVEMTRSILRKDIQLLQLPLTGNFASTRNYLQSLYQLIHAAREKSIQFVDQSFLLHSGCTINNLLLSFQFEAHEEYGYTRKINSWVNFAFENEIRELFLDFSAGQFYEASDLTELYELPHGSFAPKVLETLILKFCNFRSSSFQVFESLQRLSLVQVEIFDSSLAELASKSPLLQDVNLENCVIPENFLVSDEDITIKKLSVVNCETHVWPTYSIDLSTPCLLMLTILGSYLMTTHIQNATQLLDVFVGISEVHADHVQGEALGSLMTGSMHCQSLTLTTWSIQVLPTRNNSLERLPNAFNNLKHLCLAVGLAKQEFPGISCLLRSSPNLETLTLHMHEPEIVDWEEFQEDVLDIFDFEEQTYWETQNWIFNCLHNSLKEVVIHGFLGSINEMRLLQFLLEKARVLERISIISNLAKHILAGDPQQQIEHMQFQCQMFQMLLNFPKASTQARITLYRS
ncbi:hypothetical protein Patl1_04472 [Pistacia atlantica]|uniref:Uncharacterized protein n=1 Tax=Pistacia atlantica TaxID=434234 RepID=A0ACC1BQ42_9ROSI|nr:hypothetical protein Patl1_04472 [Pistacia atlantica]